MIDNRTVITGSFNWSPSAAHQNDEVLLVIESPLLAAASPLLHLMGRLRYVAGNPDPSGLREQAARELQPERALT